MPPNLRINYLEIPASNFDATQSFYEKAFSWSFTDYGPEYRAFSDGRLDGGFYLSDKQSSTENGATLVVLYTTSIEKTIERIKESGGSIVKETFDFPGGRRCHFADPNGNELAVWSDR